MQTFKRYSTALAAAGDQDIIEIRIKGQSLFIVPGEGYAEACEEISILTPNEGGLGRIRQGYVTPRHLKRLGNANHALTKAEAAAAATA